MCLNRVVYLKSYDANGPRVVCAGSILQCNRELILIREGSTECLSCLCFHGYLGLHVTRIQHLLFEPQPSVPSSHAAQARRRVTFCTSPRAFEVTFTCRSISGLQVCLIHALPCARLGARLVLLWAAIVDHSAKRLALFVRADQL